MKNRMLKIKNATVWPNHGAETLLQNVYIEHLQFINHDSGYNEMTSVIMNLFADEPLQIDFNADNAVPGYIHKLDVGLWIKDLSVIKLNSDDVLFIKYKTKENEVIQKLKVDGKKFDFVKV
jgi:hypothetical protein